MQPSDAGPATDTATGAPSPMPSADQVRAIRPPFEPLDDPAARPDRV